jgi:hypothetical protein
VRDRPGRTLVHVKGSGRSCRRSAVARRSGSGDGLAPRDAPSSAIFHSKARANCGLPHQSIELRLFAASTNGSRVRPLDTTRRRELGGRGAPVLRPAGHAGRFRQMTVPTGSSCRWRRRRSRGASIPGGCSIWSASGGLRPPRRRWLSGVAPRCVRSRACHDRHPRRCRRNGVQRYRSSVIVDKLH